MSHGIIFVAAEHIPTHTAKKLSKSLEGLMKIYSRSVMIVQTVLMDTELDTTIDDMMENAVVNTSASKEHVS